MTPNDLTPPPAAAEIDRLDDAIHDLLMARAEAAERLAAEWAMPALSPGREAHLVRRLLARHRGGLPSRGVVRVWRELLAATAAMRGPFTVAAGEPEPGAGLADCARAYFGAFTPLNIHRSPAQAIAEVSAGTAVAAVMPMPAEEEPAPWWTGLLHRTDRRLHVVARLPVWRARPAVGRRTEALVVSATAPDASGDDRSLIALELAPEQSKAHLAAVLAAAGFVLGPVLLRRDARAPLAQALADVAGFITDDDPRLGALVHALSPPVVLGAYAVPLEGDN
jgi:chorismate mutase / prephenate dehydratase